MDEPETDRCESGDEVRVSGEMVSMEEEGEREREEELLMRWWRCGEKAVRRRRSGVKDWKRLVRPD